MTQPFHWPSKADRAENSELNRVCAYAEQLDAEVQANRDRLSTFRAECKARVTKHSDLRKETRHQGELERTKFHEGAMQMAEQIACDVARAITTTPGQGQTFQQRVAPWMQECFGPEISADIQERIERFWEEALELGQSLGGRREDAHKLVEYVFSRPAGDPPQEVGGVMVTTAALCLPTKMDMHQCAETELARIWTMVPVIREKQKSKPKIGPLPGAYADSPGPNGKTWTQAIDHLPTEKDADPWGHVFLDLNGQITKTSVDLVRECADKSPTNEIWKARWIPTGFTFPSLTGNQQVDDAIHNPCSICHNRSCVDGEDWCGHCREEFYDMEKSGWQDCCCGEAEESWRLCPVHGPESDQKES